MSCQLPYPASQSFNSSHSFSHSLNAINFLSMSLLHTQEFQVETIPPVLIGMVDLPPCWHRQAIQIHPQLLVDVLLVPGPSTYLSGTQEADLQSCSGEHSQSDICPTWSCQHAPTIQPVGLQSLKGRRSSKSSLPLSTSILVATNNCKHTTAQSVLFSLDTHVSASNSYSKSSNTSCKLGDYISRTTYK